MQGVRSEDMEYHFIVNPKARSGRGEMIWRMLEPELKKRNADFCCHMTEKRRYARKIAAQITADGREHRIAVLGGDGTVNEVINGIREPGKVTLGYIPVGSGNDFARGLKIPKDPKKAMDIILDPRNILHMDVGELMSKGRKRRFAVSAGIGFDAAVCHEVCVSKWKILLNRIGLGKLSYAAVALDRLRKDRPVKLTATFADGTEQTFERAYFAAFMNLPCEGGGFKFCPEASPSDGKLDVIIVHGLSVLKILCLLPLAFSGKHTGFKGVTIIRCTDVQIRTENPLPLHMDGEPGFPGKEVKASLMRERLKVITG